MPKRGVGVEWVGVGKRGGGVDRGVDVCQASSGSHVDFLPKSYHLRAVRKVESVDFCSVVVSVSTATG